MPLKRQKLTYNKHIVTHLPAFVCMICIQNNAHFFFFSNSLLSFLVFLLLNFSKSSIDDDDGAAAAAAVSLFVSHTTLNLKTSFCTRVIHSNNKNNNNHIKQQ